MINNTTDSNRPDDTNEMQLPKATPNESTGIYVRGFVKITDPETGTVLVETAN
jgi:hypothetical protein